MRFGSLVRGACFGLVLGLSVGCVPQEDTDDELEDEGPLATGKWAGGAVDLTFELIVVEHDGGELTGTGTVRGVNGAANVAIDSGTHRHPKITMTLAAAGIDPLVLAGEFENDDEIRGKADGSGLSSAPFTLVRE